MDRIHFLNTGSSDCILLESDGHFALVDAAEDTDNPRGLKQLELKGYEDRVIAYLLENAADENGQVTLDFVLGTHAHSDHIGGFDTVILHPQITVKKAYLRVYDSKKINHFERTAWDNQEVYDQMVDALRTRGVPQITDFNRESFMFGNFKVTYFYFQPKTWRRYGENVDAVATLLEKDGTRILLAADINRGFGTERKLANLVGKIDLLKVGHHGLTYSSSKPFIEGLSPEIAIILNYKKNVYPDVLNRLLHDAKAEVHTSADENGIIADIGANGDIKLTTDIHKDSV